MNIVKNLLAGLGGAIALNILHESLKRANANMPRVDLLGEEALQKTLRAVGTDITDEDDLYNATLGADLFSNTIYYSFIAAGGRKRVATAFALGLAAGEGAVVLPKPMGLNPAPVARTPQVKVLTVAYYITGALVTGCILKMFEDERS